MIPGLDKYLTTEPDNGFTNFCELVSECHDFMFCLKNEDWMDGEMYNQLLDLSHQRGYSPQRTAQIIELIHRRRQINPTLDPVYLTLLEAYAERLPKETASIMYGMVAQISENRRTGEPRYYYTLYRINGSSLGRYLIQYADCHKFPDCLPKLVWSNLSREYKENIRIKGRLIQKI